MNETCALCDCRLRSPFGGKKRRKYCDWCVKNYGRLIFNLWHKRAYQKRHGLEISPLTLREILKKKKITKDNRFDRLSKYQKLRDEGLSLSEIGRRYGVSKNAIHKFLKAHDRRVTGSYYEEIVEECFTV